MRVIIVGGGKTAYYLARKFISRGYFTTLITPDPEEARQFSRRVNATVVVGDGSAPALLEEVGARAAEIVVALLPEDHDNLVVCQLASHMFGVPRTMALVHAPDNVDVFQQLGVSVAISVAQLLGQVIEEQAAYEEIINLTALEQGRVTLTEVLLPAEAPAVGMDVRDLALPRNALIATILRGDDVIVPHGDTQLLAADRLLLITQPHNHGATLRTLTGGD